MAEKRNLKRRAFSYYMQAVDNNTQKLIGYLSDISPGGFRLDCKQPLPTEQDYQLCIDLTDEVANKPFMVIVARTKWCRLDELDPFVYNIGFQIADIDPEDVEIFKRILERYGSGQ